MEYRFVKYRLKFQKVLFIAIGWALGMTVFTLHEYANLGDSGQYPNGAPYNFSNAIWITPMIAFIAGLVIGGIEIFFLTDRLRKHAFGLVLLIKSVFYFALLFCIVILGIHIYNSLIFEAGFFDANVWQATRSFLFSPFSVITTVVWSSTLIILLFILQVSDKFGQGALKDFILGKYYRPKIEKRIFMFLDMKSSTTIAEQLGHVKYFELLNDFFFHLTDPIVFRQGEIYQYVGDEIVVSWKMNKGIQDANCINCFFEIEKKIQDLAPVYIKKYGLVPGFKAGFYFGDVTTGEIGVIKKEIIFTGDVMNTTSRIQDMCKKMETNLLVSKELSDILHLEEDYQVDEIGDVPIRGRKSTIHLVSVRKKEGISYKPQAKS